MYIMCLSKGLNAIARAIDDGQLPDKKLGFIPTAGEPYVDPYFVDESRAQLKSLGLKLVELDISTASKTDIVNKINAVDGIYIAGGNVFYLSQQIQIKGLDLFIKEKIKSGLAYFGESAGAVYLSRSIKPAKSIDDPLEAPLIDGYDGLGLVDFFVLPHVDREKYKETFDNFYNSNKNNLKIVKLRDDQALLTKDGISYKILKSDSVIVS